MSAPTDPRLVWLADHDPRAIARRRREYLRAELGAGDAEVVSARAIVGGADADAARALDARVAQSIAEVGHDPGDPAPELIALLARSPLTGCTSVMDLALEASGWNPLAPDQAGGHGAFRRYVDELTRTPFFTAPPSIGHTRLAPGIGPSGDWGAFVASVTASMPGTTELDRKRIVDSVIHMAHAVFRPGGGTVHREARATLFVQQALAVNGPRIDVNLYYCQVLMAYHHTESKHASSTAAQSWFDIERVEAAFDTATWSRYAAEVARRRITAVDAWLSKTSAG